MSTGKGKVRTGWRTVSTQFCAISEVRLEKDQSKRAMLRFSFSFVRPSLMMKRKWGMTYKREDKQRVSPKSERQWRGAYVGENVDGRELRVE